MPYYHPLKGRQAINPKTLNSQDRPLTLSQNRDPPRRPSRRLQSFTPFAFPFYTLGYEPQASLNMALKKHQAEAKEPRWHATPRHATPRHETASAGPSGYPRIRPSPIIDMRLGGGTASYRYGAHP